MSGPFAQAFRLDHGTLIDRRKPIAFTFDGEPLKGFAGDTLASALLANGIHLVGRSFKYHRPRGVLSAGSEEPNALVSVDRGGGRITPNLRATQVELYDGLCASSQNCWPSRQFDIGAINQWIAPFIGAGFYYKTFMAPSWAWKHVYEPLIRQAAGLGRAPDAPDPDHYTQRYAHCDVLIVGAGAAGLAAALSASAGGARVILCDEQAEMGGGLLAERHAAINGQSAAEFVAEATRILASRANVTRLTRTTAFGYFAQNFIGLSERISDHIADPHRDLPRERLWKIRAKEVILATGAIEKPLVFANNDRPGILLASAAQNYLHRFGVSPGRRILIATATDSAYTVARDLAEAGVGIVSVIEMRDDIPEALRLDMARLHIPLITGHRVVNTKGRLRVSGVSVAPILGGATQNLACDCLLMAGGFVPAVHLFSQSRGKLRFDEVRGIFVPGLSVQAQTSCGAANGTFDLAVAIREALEAGHRAAEKAGFAVPCPILSVEAPVAGTIAAPDRIPPLTKAEAGTAFIDFQNDVTAKDIGYALEEGFHSIEHVKRYTTTGMATDQGKTSNMNALALAADKLGKSVPEIGLTTFRMPYMPVTFGAFAGHARGVLFDPVRKTPLHAVQAEAGAVFEDVGLWKRSQYFARKGESMQAAIARECLAVRQNAGLFDASTLGKIEVVGPDAGLFLDRLYAGAFLTLPVGRCRYGLLLSEAGFVMDDGVIGRISEMRYHVTTTTGGAARVLHHMEDYVQTEFPDLKVWLASTSEQWAVLALQGPHAKRILAPLIRGIDLDTMEHMSVREGFFGDVPLRLFRVSFTGEMGFELNVPPDHAETIWRELMAAGTKDGLHPYGTEAMHVLRAEKGYIILGQETDGTVTPGDLGMDWAISKKKPDFVGKFGLMRPDLVAQNRKQLVGLLTDNPALVLEEGAQIILAGAEPVGSSALGHVTSSYMSASLGRSIALALIAGGRAKIGQSVDIPMPKGVLRATITAPIFYDAKGERLHDA